MSENGRERVEKMHPKAEDRHGESSEHTLVEQTHREAWERCRKSELSSRRAPTIHYTFAEGVTAGREKYLLQAFLVQPIREWEPLLRMRGYSLPCRR